ncbi:hypothetical protein [Nocardia vinacea]|uniref:hypothetical protein n=1 Tax=Nocardia vinacea TaxID=96468 RepID=UPI0002ED8001|nr:hypothetical protein [Nocardia vinacea]
MRQLYGAVPLTDRTRDLFDDNMFGVFTAITGPGRTYLGVAPVEFPCRRSRPARWQAVCETEMIGYGFAAVRASAIDGQRHLGQDPLPG